MSKYFFENIFIFVKRHRIIKEMLFKIEPSTHCSNKVQYKKKQDVTFLLLIMYRMFKHFNDHLQK